MGRAVLLEGGEGASRSSSVADGFTAASEGRAAGADCPLGIAGAADPVGGAGGADNPLGNASVPDPVGAGGAGSPLANGGAPDPVGAGGADPEGRVDYNIHGQHPLFVSCLEGGSSCLWKYFRTS